MGTIRFKKIILPAIVSMMLLIICFTILFHYNAHMASSLGPQDYSNYVESTTAIRSMIEVFVFLFAGVVAYFLCYKREGAVIERFASGITIPLFVGFIFIIISVLYPSFLYGDVFAENPEYQWRVVGQSIINWIISMLEILLGGALIHFIIITKNKNVKKKKLK